MSQTAQRGYEQRRASGKVCRKTIIREVFMGHNKRLLMVVIPSLVCIVMLQSKTSSAQKVIPVDAARDASDPSPTARVWDARTSGDVLTLKGHSNGVVTAAFFQGGERVVTGGADCTARIWDARTGAQLIKIDKTGFNGCYASVSPDGSRILTTNHPYVKLWDAKTGDELLILVGHKRVVTAISFSPDGSRILTGSQDRTARVWDVKAGAELLTLEGHSENVTSAAFSPDGSRIVTSSWDSTARIWDFRQFCDTNSPTRAVAPPPRPQ